MNCARNYENLLNFAKVVLKILAVKFFPDTVYYRVQEELDDFKHRIRIRTEWAKLHHVLSAEVSVSNVAVFELVSGRAVVISSTAFNSDIVFAITAALKASFTSRIE